MDPLTNLRLPFCPQGRFIHVPPPSPVTDWDMSYGTPWWLDTRKYYIGHLSAKTRHIRIKNVLTSQHHELEVPSEETINEIKQRYLAFNTHASSYIWKALMPTGAGAGGGGGGEEGGDLEFDFVTLDMDKTLEENGIVDYESKYDEMLTQGDIYIPVIHIYYTDDLSEA